MWWLLSACMGVDAAEQARRACENVPALTQDAVGRLLFADLAATEELDHWDRVPRGRGLAAMGLRPFGAFRANTSCRVERVERLGPDGWAVDAVRAEPRIDDPDRLDVRSLYDGPRVERSLRLVVLPDGRVRTGVLDAWRRYQEGEGRGEGGAWSEAARTWRELHAVFPDPTLLWEIAQAEEAARLQASDSEEPP